MTTGIVDAAFPFGTNMDQFDVGLIALGTNSGQTPTGYTVTIGSEVVVIGGTGFTYDVTGAGGDDTLDGGLGNDTLNGGAGHDVITTGGGSDVIVVGLGQSAVSQAGADVITDWNAAEILTFASGPAGAGDYVETSAADFA